MAASVNKVILIGNLGKDPEIRTFQNGGRVANFSIATSESWKDKQTGERKERTEWHRISVTNDNLIPVIEQYLKKGSKVYIEGQLHTRKYQDKAGNDCYTTEVVLRPFGGTLTMLDTKRDNQSDGNVNESEATPAQQVSQGNFAATQTNAMDDEIPF